MNFVNDPVKAKTAFIITLILAIVFFLGSGTLGYLYYKAKTTSASTTSDKDKLISQKDKEITNLKKQIETLKKASTNLDDVVKENETLKTANTSLEEENLAYENGVKKANAYNEFFKYLNTVIEAHDGFTGWTDAEFQAAKTRAEATGDASFVADVNWAWYETTVVPEERMMKIWDDIASGIENALK